MQARIEISKIIIAVTDLLLKVTSPVLFLFFCVSCGNSVYYEEYSKVKQEKWDMNDIKMFQFNIQDTSASYRLIFNIRNTTDYAYSNLFLFTTTTQPDQEMRRDTVECLLSNKYGKWLGKGFGKIRESRFLIKEQFYFSDTGTYSINIEQGMRDEILHGISDIGVRIEKVTFSK